MLSKESAQDAEYPGAVYKIIGKVQTKLCKIDTSFTSSSGNRPLFFSLKGNKLISFFANNLAILLKKSQKSTPPQKKKKNAQEVGCPRGVVWAPSNLEGALLRYTALAYPSAL